MASMYYEVKKLLQQNRDKPMMDVLNNWALQKDNINTEEEGTTTATKKIPLLPTPTISQLPIGFVICPITVCQESMHQKDVMAHYIKKHRELKIERIFDDDTPAIDIVIEHKKMVRDEVYCLKVLSFGGKIKKRKENLPVVGYRAIANEGLPTSYEHLAYDLPVLIMASRTIVGIPLKPEHNGMRHGRQMLVVWPVTIETKTTAHDIYCRIFTKEPQFLKNKFTLVEMRSFRDSEWATKLLMLDPATFYLLPTDLHNINIMGYGEVILGIKLKYSEFSMFGSNGNLIKVDKNDSDNESGKTFTIDD